MIDKVAWRLKIPTKHYTVGNVVFKYNPLVGSYWQVTIYSRV